MIHPNKIFCPHWRTHCSRCRARERLLDALNWVLYGIAVGIVAYAILAFPADAVVRCHYVWEDGVPIWVCTDEPDTTDE
jgi:hypothetical protein